MFQFKENETYQVLDFYQDKNDYVECHIYDRSNNLIESKVVLGQRITSAELVIVKMGYEYIGENVYLPLVKIFPEKDLGNKQGRFVLKYNFMRRLVSNEREMGLYVYDKSSDNLELKLKAKDEKNQKELLYYSQSFESSVKNSVVNFWRDKKFKVLDAIYDIFDDSVAVKLDKEADGVELGQSCFICLDYFKSIRVEIENFEPKPKEDAVVLTSPNFSIMKDPFLSQSKDYENPSSQEVSVLKEFMLEQTDFLRNAKIRYDSFENFCFFSSARKIIENFDYKLRLIQEYQAKANSPFVSLSIKETYLRKIENIKKMFSPFESRAYLLPSNLSPLFPPKINGQVDVNSNAYKNWLSNVYLLANKFDEQNPYSALRYLPEHLTYPENEDFLNLILAIGEAFDILYYNISSFKSIKNEDLFFFFLKAKGFDVIDGFDFDSVFEYLEGQNSMNFSKRKITREIWRRLFSSLPFIMKHKGTELGLRYLLNCFGISSFSIKTFEFGRNGKMVELEKVGFVELRNGDFIEIDYSNQSRWANDFELKIIPDSFGTNDVSELLRIETLNGEYVSVQMKKAQTNWEIDFEIRTQNSYYQTINIPRNLVSDKDVFHIYLTTGVNQSNVFDYSLTVKIWNGRDLFSETKKIIQPNFLNQNSLIRIRNLGKFLEFRLFDFYSDEFIQDRTKSVKSVVSNRLEDLIFRLESDGTQFRVSGYESINYSFNFQSSVQRYGTLEIVCEYDVKDIPNSEMKFRSEIEHIRNEVIKVSNLLPKKSKNLVKDSFGKVLVGYSPSQMVNKEIISKLNARFSDFINFMDYYESEYYEMNWHKNYFFDKHLGLLKQRIKYMEFLSFYDRQLFSLLKDFVPARNKEITGGYVTNSVLHRSKIKRYLPKADGYVLDQTLDELISKVYAERLVDDAEFIYPSPEVKGKYDFLDSQIYEETRIGGETELKSGELDQFCFELDSRYFSNSGELNFVPIRLDSKFINMNVTLETINLFMKPHTHLVLDSLFLKMNYLNLRGEKILLNAVVRNEDKRLSNELFTLRRGTKFLEEFRFERFFDKGITTAFNLGEDLNIKFLSVNYPTTPTISKKKIYGTQVLDNFIESKVIEIDFDRNMEKKRFEILIRRQNSFVQMSGTDDKTNWTTPNKQNAIEKTLSGSSFLTIDRGIGIKNV